MKVLQAKFEDLVVQFNDGAWGNSTVIAVYYDKRIESFFRKEGTKVFMQTLARELNLPDVTHLYQTRRGRNVGGTWMHPYLLMEFGRWVDPEFGVWCAMQISDILAKKNPQLQWLNSRESVASGFREMNSSYSQYLKRQGVTPEKAHFQQEAMKINAAMGYGYNSVNRDLMAERELRVLAHVERMNKMLLDLGYDEAFRNHIVAGAADFYRENIWSSDDVKNGLCPPFDVWD